MNNFLIMIQLLRRDFYAFKKRLLNYGINFFFIFPFLTITVLGYIQPHLYFPQNAGKASIVLIVGSLVFNMILLCYNFHSPILYDLEADRFIDYLSLVAAPSYLLAELILFPILIASCLIFPFFVFAYLLLPEYFAGLQVQWLGLFGMIVTTALAASCYIMTAIMLIKKTTNIRQFWLRVNWPLFVLGGFWLPWMLMKKFSPFLGKLALFNPIMYMTEGIRSALFGTDQFIPYYFCMIALIIFSCIFIAILRYFFKIKLDHI